MRLRLSLFSPALLLFSLLAAACGSPSDAAPPSADGGPDSASDGDAADSGGDGGAPGLGVGCTGAAPTLSKDVYPLLRASCSGGEICHGGFGSSPSEAWKALVNAPSSRGQCASAGVLVSPRSLDDSYLMHKLTGKGMCINTQAMPRGQKLPDSDIQTFADWICQGAKNN